MDIIRKCALTGARNLATRICASDVTIQTRIAVVAKRPLSYTQESPSEIAGRSESDRMRLCTYENGEKVRIHWLCKYDIEISNSIYYLVFIKQYKRIFFAFLYFWKPLGCGYIKCMI